MRTLRLHADSFRHLNRIKSESMLKKLIPLLIILVSSASSGQEKAFELFLSDSSMKNSSVSICIINATTGDSIFSFCPEKSLMPASVMKLITTSAALELLGPEYRFRTTIGYTGTLNRNTGKLIGDIVIKGGGDPALGSGYFREHYKEFLLTWINDLKNAGIKKIYGNIITDDSYYDYQPVPAKWLWEDTGNYYGAGVFGLSVFDNTYDIHFRTSGNNSVPVIMDIIPAECNYLKTIMLTASGNTDKGYIFAAPYSNYGWIAGSIPAGRDDFVLKGAITDPPLLLAEILFSRLDSAGIEISGKPTTTRIEKKAIVNELTIVSETLSPALKQIIEVLNHESVNLFAEHLLKELGKVYKGMGSTSAGIEVIYSFLEDSGTGNNGVFLEDGSGLSPLNSISAGSLAHLLFYMKNSGRYFDHFYASLPEAGNEGTLKNYFRDPVFISNLRAKSGSMTRVRSYAGYLKTDSGKELIFTIIINGFSGSSSEIIKSIESVLKETVINN